MAPLSNRRKVSAQAMVRRDPRSPLPTSPYVTRVMMANRAKDTNPELLLRSAIRRIGLKGYRTNWRRLPGRPDLAFPSGKLAVFLHGCFWHRCPRCNLPLPKSNREYWRRHFLENQRRDRRKIAAIEAMGWHVMVLWECEVNEDNHRCARAVQRILGNGVGSASRNSEAPPG